MSTRRPSRARPSDRITPDLRAATPSIPAAVLAEPITVTATEAQNEFGRVFDSAVRDHVVIITRHNAPRAVLLSIDRYNALVGAGAAALDTLAGEFDALLARMQSPKAQAGMRRAFGASPQELGQAAVAAAKPRGRAR